ncbi:MAG TPA: hypothetical protein HPQ03_09865 [Deltaproteobacteria bacterium]|nr:hypothetical protein [Deltaproteobacteria bacterium]
MNPLAERMEKIKMALRNKDLTGASTLLVKMLASDDLFSYWSRCSQGSERIPNILRYVSRIIFDPDISTAQINLLEGTVRLSPAFFLEHMVGPEDVLFILLHERNHLILHKLWPDAAEPDYPPDLFNWAEDVYINSMARRQVLSTLPERFYSDGDPMRLLLTGRHSAVNWETISYKVEGENLFKNAHASFYAQAAELLAAIQEPPVECRDFSGYHQWMYLVLEWWHLRKEEQKTEAIIKALSDIPPLVSNHGPGPVRNLPIGRVKDGLEAQPIPDISPNDPVVKMVLASCEIPEIRTRFEVFDNAKVGMVETLIGGVISQRATVCFHEGYSVMVPHSVTRKDAFNLSMGAAPVLWQQYVGMEKPAVDLYVDVSGSMSRFYMFIPFIYKSILHVVGRIFQFSTQVVEVDQTERCLFTTGGTSFNEVAEHMLAENVRWAILVSDGLSALNTDLEKALARQIEHLVYLKVQHNGYCNWEKIAKDVVLLQGGGA